jgi:hypothetical protein
VARRLTSATLIVIGGALLASWASLWWAEQNLYDVDSAVQLAVRELESPAVRAALADQIIIVLPDAGSLTPAVRVVVLGSIDTDAFRAVYAEAMRAAHRFATDETIGALSLDLTPFIPSLIVAVARISPEFAAQISPDLIVQIDLVRRSDLPAWFELVASLPTLSIVVGVAGAVGVIAGIAFARSRLTGVGGALLVIGLASGAISVMATALPRLIAEQGASSVGPTAQLILDNILHGLVVQSAAIAVAGTVIGAGLIAGAAIMARG